MRSGSTVGLRSHALRLSVLVVVLLNAVALLPASASAPAAVTSGFYIVAFDGRITDADRSALARTGAAIIDYEPDDSYIVWANAAQVKAASGLAGVEKIGALTEARKLDDVLAATGGALEPAAITVYGGQIQSFLSFIDQFGEVIDTHPIRADGLLHSVRIPLGRSVLDEVLDHPAVMYVSRGSLRAVPEDERGTQIIAGNVNPPSQEPGTFPGYRRWLKKVNLNGKGVIVSIVDTGITAHHPDFSDRVVKTYDYSIGEPGDTYGHGSHVTGIVGGAPGDPVLLKDPDGFAYGQGVAPQVKFIDQNAVGLFASEPLIGPGFPPPDGLQTLSRDAWKAGARMWNASWHTGEGNKAGYLASVRTTDEMARNAMFEKKGSEEFLMVFSAGNSGAGGPTVPKEAKNIIAVGSTASGRGIHYPVTTNIDEVSSFSSRGPTLDGRIFPTVSAPGDEVVSARALEGSAQSLCGPPLDAAALYCQMSGTSMAAPHVAGASALIHQWWKRSHGGKLPSPAMVKALLVNSAKDIGFKDIPNINEGWGRVNLGELFGKAPSTYIDQKKVMHSARDKATYNVKVTKGRDVLKVTLAWSDAPAAVGAKKVLVNDLDLTVRRAGGGPVWRGNFFRKGTSVSGGKADRLNNLENVFLRKVKPGIYRVTVDTANLPGDGVPENKDKTDQDFALVMRSWGVKHGSDSASGSAGCHKNC